MKCGFAERSTMPEEDCVYCLSQLVVHSLGFITVAEYVCSQISTIAPPDHQGVLPLWNHKPNKLIVTKICFES